MTLKNPVWEEISRLVSILVLVDLILWRHPLIVWSFNLLSFNPCFGGSYIMTAFAGKNEWSTYKFQSLFWWILYYDTIYHIMYYNRDKFQSLFWWILYYDSAFSSASINPSVFQSLFWWILYYDEETAEQTFERFLFQSLFWWILYYDVTLPYCLEILSKVSILVLVDLILWLWLPIPQKWYSAVSILVLVDLILWHMNWATENNHLHLFQSLFWWILYYDRANGVQVLRHRRVSILVLVDLILWPLKLSKYKEGRCVSILVLVDLILWQLCYFFLPPREIVSILVLVDLILWREAGDIMNKPELSFNPCFGGSYIMTVHD